MQYLFPDLTLHNLKAVRRFRPLTNLNVPRAVEEVPGPEVHVTAPEPGAGPARRSSLFGGALCGEPSQPSRPVSECGVAAKAKLDAEEISDRLPATETLSS